MLQQERLGRREAQIPSDDLTYAMQEARRAWWAAGESGSILRILQRRQQPLFGRRWSFAVRFSLADPSSASILPIGGGCSGPRRRGRWSWCSCSPCRPSFDSWC